MNGFVDLKYVNDSNNATEQLEGNVDWKNTEQIASVEMHDEKYEERLIYKGGWSQKM